MAICLNEIRACRPFFIGLLGERYGWVPSDDAFTADLREEQPWLKDLHGKSVTELEILHGVLNHPEMAGRAFFYFRDPKYAESVPAEKGSDFTAENGEAAEKLKELNNRIRARFVVPPSGGQENVKVPPSGGPHATSPTEPAKAGTPNESTRGSTEIESPRPHLRDNYPDPVKLAALVLEDLKAVARKPGATTAPCASACANCAAASRTDPSPTSSSSSTTERWRRFASSLPGGSAVAAGNRAPRGHGRGRHITSPAPV